MPQRGLLLVLLTVLVVSGSALAFEVECYVMPSPDNILERYNFSYTPARGFQLVSQAVIGTLDPAIVGTAMTPDGQLLGLDEWNNRIVEIDTETGDSRPLVDLDADVWPYSDIAVNSEGALFLTQDTRLCSVDRSTGHVEVIIDTGIHMEILGSWSTSVYASGWASGPYMLLQIDPSSGETVVLDSFGTSSGIVALSSGRQDLFAVYGIGWSAGGGCFAFDAYLKVISPTSGRPVHQLQDWYYPPCTDAPGMTIIEVRGPTIPLPGQGIPAAGPFALVLLALFVAGAGLIALRRL